MQAANLLNEFLDSVRQATGASHATALLCMEPLDRQTMVVAGRGDGDAVPEFADEASAWQFLSQYAAGNHPDRRVVSIPGRNRGDTLLRVAVDQLLVRRRSERLAIGERRAEPEVSTAPARDGAIWIGLSGAKNPAALHDEIDPDEADAAHGQQPALSLTHVCLRLAWSVYHQSQLLQDPVSQLPGRMEMQIFLKRALMAVRRNQQAIGLMLVNPDDFTMINVRYGRRQGDQGIRQIAETLERCLRQTDGVFHYGGAIFAAVLPATDMAQCRAAAEKLRRELSSTRYVDGTVALTFSIGAAVAVADDIAGNSGIETEISQRADAALNGARLSGGARIIVTNMAGGDGLDRALVNPLSGIFAADTEKDYRNMLLLWETVALISTQTVPEAIATEFVDRLAIGFRPDRVALYSVVDGDFHSLASNVRDDSADDGRASGRAFELDEHDRAVIAEALETGRVARAHGRDSDATGFCAYAVPLVSQDSRMGCIYLDAEGHRLQLDSSDIVFLNALASQMAVAMDRAALSARWIREKDRESRKLREEVHELRQALHYSRMIYQSSAMHAVMETLRKVAPSDATVLIIGESGTGKEMLAQSLHELSDRRAAPFVVFDCGAVAASLLEAELFGHTRGAFTGAERASAGRIAQADGGTLFLDEIGELPLDVQAKLLRFVQEKEFSPVGSSETRQVDVRIVAATNRRLQDEVRAGRFRSDLYYRLRVIAVQAVPLRDRTDDILPLAHYFLEKFAAQYGALSHALSPAAERKLLEHPWPGNVRELQHCILRAVLTSGAEVLDAEAIEMSPDATADTLPSPATPGIVVPPRPMLCPANDESAVRDQVPTNDDPWPGLQQELERQVNEAFQRDHRRPVPIGRWLTEDLVLTADESCGNVARRAARLLGVPESTFRRQLEKANVGARTGSDFRTDGWSSIRPLIRRVVDHAQRLPSPHGNLLDRARDDLLTCVHHTAAARPAAGAALMGVTPPTYKRWLEARKNAS